MRNRKSYIALAVVSVLWGTTYIAARIGVREIPGLYMAGLRQILSGLILVSFFMLRGYKIPGWDNLKKLFIQGLLLLCVSNGFVTWSVQYITSGLAAIIAGLVPICIAIFSVLLLKNARFTKVMGVGLLLGFGGILTIFYEYLDQLVNPAFTFGICLSLISVLSWSFGSVYSSKHKVPVELLFAAGIQMLFAGVILIAASALTGNYVSPDQIGFEGFASLAYLIVFGSLIAYSAFVYCINKLPATQVSIYAYINPIVAVILGSLLLNERMNVNVITGTLITLCGVYLVNRDFRKQQSATINRKEEHQRPGRRFLWVRRNAEVKNGGRSQKIVKNV